MSTAVAPRTLRLEFSLPVNIANARLHWREKDQRRKSFLEVCDNRVLAKINPPHPETPFTRAKAELIVRTMRRCDPDNAVARTKWIWDWLTTRGYLVGDSQRHLTLTTTILTTPRSQTGITVKLTEVSGMVEVS